MPSKYMCLYTQMRAALSLGQRLPLQLSAVNADSQLVKVVRRNDCWVLRPKWNICINPQPQGSGSIIEQWVENGFLLWNSVLWIWHSPAFMNSGYLYKIKPTPSVNIQQAALIWLGYKKRKRTWRGKANVLSTEVPGGVGKWGGHNQCTLFAYIKPPKHTHSKLLSNMDLQQQLDSLHITSPHFSIDQGSLRVCPQLRSSWQLLATEGGKATAGVLLPQWIAHTYMHTVSFNWTTEMNGPAAKRTQFLQRTSTHFPASASGCAQPSLTPVQGSHLMLSQQGHQHTHINSQSSHTFTPTKLYKNKKGHEVGRKIGRWVSRVSSSDE